MLLRKFILITAAVILPAAAATAQYTEERARTAESEMEQALNDLSADIADADKAALRASQDDWRAFRESQCAAQATLNTGPNSRTARIAKPLVARDCRTRMADRRKSQLAGLHRTVVGYKEWRRRYPNRYGSTATACRLANLPGDFEVVAIGARKGLEATDQQLDLSGRVTMQSSVVVDYPAKPVLLVLMSSDPVIWRISYTQETRFAGVIAASRSKQAVLGVPKSVPMHLAGRNTNRHCGVQVAYQGGRVLDRADKWVKRIAGRGIDQMIVLAKQGAFRVGAVEPVDPARLDSSPDYTIRDFTDLEPFPPGKRGIDQLLQKGLLRMATEEDIAAWRQIADNDYDRFERRLSGGGRYSLINRAYVVLGKLNLPNGLTGRDQSVFIVPKGAPRPGGAASGPYFLWMETGECTRGVRYRCRVSNPNAGVR